jgi:hypothetical protein
MSWTSKDKFFLSILKEFGEKQVEPVIQNANKLLGSLPVKKRPELLFFGDYQPSLQLFTWNKDLQRIQYDMILRNYMNVFGDDSTLKKLFQDKVKLSHNYQNVIAYLLKIVNAAFHVVRIPFQNRIYFALVKLSLKDTIDFDMFDHLMFSYRQYAVLHKKRRMTRHYRVKKSRKTKSKR